jgi:hypothetical protein
VKTSNNETFDIDRIDRQGALTPPRWDVVKIGEPTTRKHNYVNYVKGSPDSLFRHQGLKARFAASIPKYPQDVYDYHRLDRLVTVGVDVDDRRAWNNDLSEINADLGHAKQVNIALVIVRNLPQDYYYALEEAWIGGKKNDAILVMSVDDANEVQWATVMCWTTNELFKIQLRDDIMAIKTLGRDPVMAALRKDVEQSFVRKPMKDFEYLEASIVPSEFDWLISILVGLVFSVGLVWYFSVNPIGLEYNGYSSYRRQRWDEF